MMHSHDSDHASRPLPTPRLAPASPEQIAQICRSFDAIWPVRREVAAAFYRRFFELAPEAQNMLPDEAETPHVRLMDTIATLVVAFDNPELFQSIASPIGHRDAQLAANSTDFATFGDALLWTLEQQFGPAFTPELRQAWRALYEVVRSDAPHTETPDQPVSNSGAREAPNTSPASHAEQKEELT